jgi:toxin HigB-1
MSVAIRTFKRSEIANVCLDGRLERRAGWVRIAKVVTRKLDMIHYAQRLDDLRSPPANRLEALKGDVAGFQSVRVNNQWRIVFRWTDDGAVDVDVTDYHG